MLSFIFKVYRLINLHQIHHLTLISRNLSYVKLWYFSYRKVMGQSALKTPFWYVFKIGWSNFWIIYIKRNPTSHEWNFLPNFRSTGIFLDFCTPLLVFSLCKISHPILVCWYKIRTWTTIFIMQIVQEQEEKGDSVSIATNATRAKRTNKQWL